MGGQEYLNNYLEPFINKIVVVDSIKSQWQQNRASYLYKGEITNQKLRNVLPNEIIIEFDYNLEGKNNPAQAKKEAQRWHEKVRLFLDNRNIKYHVSDHNGKSPHIRLQIHGLELFRSYVRGIYKLEFVGKIAKEIKFSSNLLMIDESLLNSKNKLVSLELQPHFKPEWNGNIEEITYISTGKNFRPNPKVLHRIEDSRKIDSSIKCEQVNIEDIFYDKLQNWWDKHYKEGVRNALILAFAGICRSYGISQADCNNLLLKLQKSVKKEYDIKTENQLRKIDYTYKCDNPGVFHFLKEVFSEDTDLHLESQKLHACFRKVDDKLWSANDLMDANIPPIQWLIPDMVEENGYHIVAGRPGEFKSYATLFMAKALISGGVFLNKQITRQCKVLYVDEESRIQRLKHRLHKMMEDVTREQRYNLSFAIGKGTRFTHEHINILEQDIIKFEPDVIFMDSLSRFFMGNENSSEDIKQIYNDFIKPLMIKYNVTIIIIHHYNKSNDKTGGNMLRGSTELQAQIDGFMAVKKITNDLYSISMPKSRDDKVSDAIKFEVIDKSDDKIDIVFKGCVNIDNRSAKEKHADHLIEELYKLELGNEEFNGQNVLKRVKKNGLSDKSMYNALMTLVTQEKLERVKNGWFKMVEEEFEEIT